MTPAASLVADLNRRGVQLWREGDRLAFDAPRRALTAEDVETLRQRKAEILAVLDRDARATPLVAEDDQAVAWRVAAMRPQVPPRGPIPFLVARSVAAQPRCCLSCGDPLADGNKYRCRPCVTAATAVLDEIREGVQQ